MHQQAKPIPAIHKIIKSEDMYQLIQNQSRHTPLDLPAI